MKRIYAVQTCILSITNKKCQLVAKVTNSISRMPSISRLSEHHLDYCRQPPHTLFSRLYCIINSINFYSSSNFEQMYDTQLDLSFIRKSCTACNLIHMLDNFIKSFVACKLFNAKCKFCSFKIYILSKLVYCYSALYDCLCTLNSLSYLS